MLRKATKKDLIQIYKLIDLCSRMGKILKRNRKELEKVINCFFVYENGNKIIGCCSLEIYNKKLAELRSLAVLPEYQGKGIGSSLVKECIKKTKKEKIYEVLAVTDKDNLFEKLGFSKQI